MSGAEVMYRYDGISDYVGLVELKVVKHTPQGKWVDYYGVNKFVLNNARKRFAHETEALAKESFLARKRRQKKILQAQLECVDAQIEKILSGNLGPQYPKWEALEFTL